METGKKQQTVCIDTSRQIDRSRYIYLSIIYRERERKREGEEKEGGKGMEKEGEEGREECKA